MTTAIRSSGCGRPFPSNTLACLNGLAEDARRRQVLGPDVEIASHTYDETNRRVRAGPDHPHDRAARRSRS